MLHNLEKFTRKYLAFSAEELFLLAGLFKPLSIEENGFIFKKGRLVSNIYFLNNGVLKSYSDQNKEKSNLKFYSTPIFFSDINVLLTKTTATRNLVSVTESDLFIAKFDDIVKLNAASKKHNRFFKMIFKDNYMFNGSSNLYNS